MNRREFIHVAGASLSSWLWCYVGNKDGIAWSHSLDQEEWFGGYILSIDELKSGAWQLRDSKGLYQTTAQHQNGWTLLRGIRGEDLAETRIKQTEDGLLIDWVRKLT